MKRTYYIAITLAALLSTSACDDNISASKVPDAVKTQFASHYPSIDKVEWEQHGELFEAEFAISGRDREALFRGDGTLVSYTEEIEERYLPASILAQLEQQYTAYTLDEAHRIMEGTETRYKVELENKKKELQLIFSENGELLERDFAQPDAPLEKQEATLVPSRKADHETVALAAPTAQWELPAMLREVSGIALLETGQMLCVQDELGILFVYDLNSRKITREIPFGEPGDYEGLALVGNTAYVLRSDGALFEVQGIASDKQKVKDYTLAFPATINMEGLAYDAKNERLLLAPKGYDSKLNGAKGIYAFSLSDKKLLPEPVLTISMQQVRPKVSGKQQQGYDVLQASSLEVHPGTGELYLLEAANNRLHTLDWQGNILKTAELNKKDLRQAEGITFGPDGTCYITSEGGKKGKGVILQYNSVL